MGSDARLPIARIARGAGDRAARSRSRPTTSTAASRKPTASLRHRPASSSIRPQAGTPACGLERRLPERRRPGL